MVRGSRVAYAVLAWAFVLGLLLQVFFIGSGLLGGSPGAVETHRNFGWLLHLSPLLILLFAFLARAGKRHWQWALALALVVFLVPIFVILRDSTPMLGAFHPVAAMLAFVLAVFVAMNSLASLRDQAATTTG